MTIEHKHLGDLQLFTGTPQHGNFSRMAELVPTRAMPASASPRQWPSGAPLTLPDTFGFNGAHHSVEALLTETDTAALLVLKDGEIRFEGYWLTGGPEVPWLSMSVAKSFVSALVGIALDEGHIPSIDTPVSDIIPVDSGSAYDGVSVRDVLHMSSGARWNEDYSDPNSEVHRLGRALSPGGSIDAFVASMEREHEPGTISHYNSADTQVLGALVSRATGRTLADYMTEKLVEPLGMTSPGHWLIDSSGTELSFNGLNLTARDYARLGELYRADGVVNGVRVLPEKWVRDSVTVAAPHLEAGRVLVAGHPVGVGYGYQWWIPEGDRGEFMAIGVYNQFVYVDPAASTTIVKLSANRRYGTSPGESVSREMQTIEFLRALARTNG
ncbi:serine hydrolase domain-containing protein [Streptomyces scopuliridis]|uniref:serine hydrolase domain-containing protein n=1 Tax=Streptomyces scopuliridis TaxID=452529 RepID=UPI0036C82C2E